MGDVQPIHLKLIAPNGRMGKAIAAAAAQDSGFVLADDRFDVIVDFSAPDALAGSLDQAVSAKVPILVGTTGLDHRADERISIAAKHVAVLKTSNTSVGVALLADLVERAARILGPDWDIEISETHHRMKVDAPSGTALSLGAAAAHGRGASCAEERVPFGRGFARKRGTIGYASLRGGTVAGDHDVMFLGPDERLILSHRAENRMVFARGALIASRFLVSKSAGLYGMKDVVGDTKV